MYVHQQTLLLWVLDRCQSAVHSFIPRASVLPVAATLLVATETVVTTPAAFSSWSSSLPPMCCLAKPAN